MNPVTPREARIAYEQAEVQLAYATNDQRDAYADLAKIRQTQLTGWQNTMAEARVERRQYAYRLARRSYLAAQKTHYELNQQSRPDESGPRLAA